MSEVWKPVCGYQGWYEVSRTGLVRSVDRITSNGRLRRGKTLSPITTQHGYLVVNLNRNGTSKQRFIHELVLESFVGPKPIGMVCCHGVQGQQVNCVENLSYKTQAENLGPDRNRDRDYTSKQTGVHFNKPKNKWEVKVRGKYLGTFQSEQEAIDLARTKYGY